MKDNSTNTAVEMTTEEFHKLLEENTQQANNARSDYQVALAAVQGEYNETIDFIIQAEKSALADFRKAREEFERAKDTYDALTRKFAKARNEAGHKYNLAKAREKNGWCLNNNRLQSERHNLFERFRDSGGAISRRCERLTSPRMEQTKEERSE
jgi:hypothetical protein|nr:MAG TPA_asm: hypothetical protein [Bacteriophage sp.]